MSPRSYSWRYTLDVVSHMRVDIWPKVTTGETPESHQQMRHDKNFSLHKGEVFEKRSLFPHNFSSDSSEHIPAQSAVTLLFFQLSID